MANFILEDLKQIFGKRNNILSQIIVLNVAVFIVFNIIENFYPISNWFALPGTFGEYILKFWTLISYMFLHGGFFHILFNMLWLYWMGQILLEYLGAKKFTAIYFFGGIAGGAAFLIINQALPIYCRVSVRHWLGWGVSRSNGGCICCSYLIT